MKSGCPSASAAIAEALTASVGVVRARSAVASAMASGSDMGPISIDRTSQGSALATSSRSFLRIETVESADTSCRARSMAMSRRLGASGGRITSASCAMLSASTHWRSSITMTSG